MGASWYLETKVSTGMVYIPRLVADIEVHYFWPCMYEEGANRAARGSLLERRYRGEREEIRAIGGAL